MTLDDDDLRSPTWKKIEAYLTAHLEKLRLKNESDALDAIATARMRGRIRETRHFLTLGRPPDASAPETTADD